MTQQGNKQSKSSKAIRWTYNVLRAIAVTILALVVLPFALSYLALSTPWVQNKIKAKVEQDVSNYLKTNVTIDKVSISPFNEVLLTGVTIPDQQGDSLIVIDKLGAGIDLGKLIMEDGKLSFTYGEIIGLHGRITRPDNDSPTNLQFIIDAFKPKDDKGPTPFDVEVFNVVIRKSDLSYDVLDKPKRATFDPNHVFIANLNADITLPRLRNNDFDIDLRRLTFRERSGFDLNNLSTHVTINDTALNVEDLIIRLPNSLFRPDNITLRYNSLKTIGDNLKGKPMRLRIAESHVTPSDLAPFVPKLATINTPVDIALEVEGTPQSLNVPVLSLKMRDETLVVDLSGHLRNLDKPANINVNLPHLTLHGNAKQITNLTSNFAQLTEQAKSIITNCGDITIDGSLSGNPDRFKFNGDISTSLGNVAINGEFSGLKRQLKHFGGTVNTEGFQLGKLLNKTDLLGDVALAAKMDGTINGKQLNGDFDGKITYIDLKNYRYNNIVADVQLNNKNINGTINIDDPSGKVSLQGNALLAGEQSMFDFSLDADDVNLARILPGKTPVNHISRLNVDAQFTGNKFDNADGFININELSFTDKNNKPYRLDYINVVAANSKVPQQLQLSTGFLNASIEGKYKFQTVATTFQDILSQVFPSLIAAPGQLAVNAGNEFTFNAVINPTEELERLINLPVKPVYETTVSGHVSDSDDSFSAHISAPYLQQGKNIIEGTTVHLERTASDAPVILSASSAILAKTGRINLNLNAIGEDDVLKTNVSWAFDRPTDYHGDITLNARLDRDNDNRVSAEVDLMPSEIIVNDTIWSVEGGHIKYANRAVSVDNLRGSCDKQFIQLYGTASDNPDDQLVLTLNDISLDYIFQTLKINHVDFGGKATGKFLLSNLFSKSPVLYTPKLYVEALHYNGALMGDGEIESHWLNDEKAVSLYCDLHQRNGLITNIDGTIDIDNDSLYLAFNANRANVEFMQPFMKAFAGDVRGEVSGNAVLSGNFSTIDLEGDVHADSLAMKIDYTNVYYYCINQDIHIVPGYIAINNVALTDRDGHPAKLNGYLKHDAFHDPVFNFTITDTHDLLIYDTNPKINEKWYGTVYGNGAAVISGEPGVVKINVNMESAQNTKFTFVLTDTKEANEYNFITFRDRDVLNKPVEQQPEMAVDTIPDIVKELTRRIEKQNQDNPSSYYIDLQADITPEAQLNLIMDPVGGDRIKAYGTGNLRLNYNSDTQAFEMFGKYTLERGNYNFTLQEIIRKDFAIDDGSSISFNGDPFNAMLNIKAHYALNANIRDLDESFASDRDINRTNVPVHAMLNVNGELTHPDISFDLDFPTLTSETIAKVKSVISTDDMMNRQIIYLLALNRFYTPDYMGNNSNGNEFSSVASSTLSSQLGNMLGKISENWSITPYVRSERGDFSDVEVDLALSSQLLNNRLLLNGNFGYRDNTYNTRNSNFIGDFDLEYLLNRRGSIRLKAYNHFNDQNLYVRNAMTTQGVGVVFKHDFDHYRAKKQNLVPQDSTNNNDSIPR